MVNLTFNTCLQGTISKEIVYGVFIKHCFFIDSVDTQVMSLPELGDLRKIRVLHDNIGDHPSWLLDKVIDVLIITFMKGLNLVDGFIT